MLVLQTLAHQRMNARPILCDMFSRSVLLHQHILLPDVRPIPARSASMFRRRRRTHDSLLQNRSVGLIASICVFACSSGAASRSLPSRHSCTNLGYIQYIFGSVFDLETKSYHLHNYISNEIIHNFAKKANRMASPGNRCDMIANGVQHTGAAVVPSLAAASATRQSAYSTHIGSRSKPNLDVTIWSQTQVRAETVKT